MKIAKATPEDFEATLDFLHAAELMLDRDRYAFHSPYDNYVHNLDEDDDDYRLIQRLREGIAKEEGATIDDVDGRIVAYEFLRRKFAGSAASGGWRRVYWAANVLVDNVCDPHEDCLAYRPQLYENHVSPEQ